MSRVPVKEILICLMIATWSMVACNNTLPENSLAVATTNVSESVVTEAPTDKKPTVILPTASAPTPTPTKGPPTATSTLAVPPSATPTLTPTPLVTPTLTLASSPQIYIVETYDTLLGIAIEFGTTVEALTIANGINENDFLQIGQEIIIPVPGQNVTVSNKAVVVASQEILVDTTTQNITTANNEQVVPAPAEAIETTADNAIQTESSPVVSVGAPPSNIARVANINPLTGLPVNDVSKLQRRPLLIRVGNDVAARQSQAGLNSADMVYEEIAEWWVTRFTAIFLSTTPSVVAPIRSARLMNVQLAPQYQGALAHSGGSDPVRWEISQASLVNLDEFYNAKPYFYRPNEGWQTRLGVDTVAAREYMVGKDTEASVSLHGFLFSNTLTRGESGEQLFIPYPRVTSRTEWHYDAASGKYLRWINESPLYDVGSGAQVAASNVIVYFAEHRATDIVEDSNGNTSIRIIVNGQGSAWFFRDGKLNKGFWQTDGTRTPYFSYADGTPYTLKPGNTWVEVVPTYYTIGLNSPDEASAVGR